MHGSNVYQPGTPLHSDPVPVANFDQDALGGGHRLRYQYVEHYPAVTLGSVAVEICRK